MCTHYSFFLYFYKKWCEFLTQNWQSIHDFLHRSKELCMLTMQMYQQSKKNILLLRNNNNYNNDNDNNNNDNNNNNNKNNNTKSLIFELGPQNRSPAVHKAETSLQHWSTSQQKLHAIQNIKHFGLKNAKRLKSILETDLKKQKQIWKDYSLYKSSVYITSGVAITISSWTRNLN